MSSTRVQQHITRHTLIRQPRRGLLRSIVARIEVPPPPPPPNQRCSPYKDDWGESVYAKQLGYERHYPGEVDGQTCQPRDGREAGSLSLSLNEAGKSTWVAGQIVDGSGIFVADVPHYLGLN